MMDVLIVIGWITLGACVGMIVAALCFAARGGDE